jgi:shikimate dehydrogenase
VISGETRLVALLGHPVAKSLSPRMQNAAFAARGLDWAYVACDVEPGRLADAIEGLVALGFAGANVTVPFKQEAAAIADEAEGDAVNTLVFDRGAVLAFNTDKEILAGVSGERAAVIGSGGAARALLPALTGEVRTFSRREEWPPVTDGCDVVVHATPVVDELLFEPRAEQTVVDLAYRGNGEPTAIVAAAREAGATVIDGLEALVRQGAASFERWTGVPAPVDVMRAALGLNV